MSGYAWEAEAQDPSEEWWQQEGAYGGDSASSHGQDQWANYTGTGGSTLIGMTTDGAADGLPPPRIVHDVPPTWDGKDPEKQLDPYLKVLKGWLTTTRTVKSQQGLIILNYATDDLKVVIDELDIDELTKESSGQDVFDHIKKSYAEYLERKLPQALEECLFDPKIHRQKTETMLPFVLRVDKLFKKLKKAGCDLPDDAKGYLLLRNAKLPDQARDLVEMWSGGKYDYVQMQGYLKRLERPTPGAGGNQRMLGLVGFAGDDDPSANPQESEPQSVTLVQMSRSLYLMPEAFDDDFYQHHQQHFDNEDILFVAGDIPDDAIFEEDEAVALLANYGQVRKYLHNKHLSRGFFPNQQPQKGKGSKGGKAGGGKGKQLALTDGKTFVPPPPQYGARPFNTGRPKLWTKRSLLERTKCARCGQRGHWARSCTNPPDERGKQRAGMYRSGTGFMISNPPAEVPQATLVTHTNENPEKSTPSAEDGPREGADANDLTSLVQNKSENSLLKAVNLHHVPPLGGSSAEAGPRDDARLEKDRNRTWRMNKKLEELSDFLGIGECILSRFSSSDLPCTSSVLDLDIPQGVIGHSVFQELLLKIGKTSLEYKCLQIRPSFEGTLDLFESKISVKLKLAHLCHVQETVVLYVLAACGDQRLDKLPMLLPTDHPFADFDVHDQEAIWFDLKNFSAPVLTFGDYHSAEVFLQGEPTELAEDHSVTMLVQAVDPEDSTSLKSDSHLYLQCLPQPQCEDEQCLDLPQQANKKCRHAGQQSTTASTHYSGEQTQLDVGQDLSQNKPMHAPPPQAAMHEDHLGREELQPNLQPVNGECVCVTTITDPLPHPTWPSGGKAIEARRGQGGFEEEVHGTSDVPASRRSDEETRKQRRVHVVALCSLLFTLGTPEDLRDKHVDRPSQRFQSSNLWQALRFNVSTGLRQLSRLLPMGFGHYGKGWQQIAEQELCQFCRVHPQHENGGAVCSRRVFTGWARGRGHGFRRHPLAGSTEPKTCQSFACIIKLMLLAAVMLLTLYVGTDESFRPKSFPQKFDYPSFYSIASPFERDHSPPPVQVFQHARLFEEQVLNPSPYPQGTPHGGGEPNKQASWGDGKPLGNLHERMRMDNSVYNINMYLMPGTPSVVDGPREGVPAEEHHSLQAVCNLYPELGETPSPSAEALPREGTGPSKNFHSHFAFRSFSSLSDSTQGRVWMEPLDEIPGYPHTPSDLWREEALLMQPPGASNPAPPGSVCQMCGTPTEYTCQICDEPTCNDHLQYGILPAFEDVRDRMMIMCFPCASDCGALEEENEARWMMERHPERHEVEETLPSTLSNSAFEPPPMLPIVEIPTPILIHARRPDSYDPNYPFRGKAIVNADIDTRYAIIGEHDYAQLAQHLRTQHNLFPRDRPLIQQTFNAGFQVQKVVEVQIAIGGVSLSMETAVLETRDEAIPREHWGKLPFILPRWFAEVYGAVFEVGTTGPLRWTHRELQHHNCPITYLGEGNVAIDVVAFPRGGWIDPCVRSIGSSAYMIHHIPHEEDVYAVPIDSLRFSTRNIRSSFKGVHGSLFRMFRELFYAERPFAYGSLLVNPLPDGTFLAHSNRRLWVYKELRALNWAKYAPCLVVHRPPPTWKYTGSTMDSLSVHLTLRVPDDNLHLQTRARDLGDYVADWRTASLDSIETVYSSEDFEISDDPRVKEICRARRYLKCKREEKMKYERFHMFQRDPSLERHHMVPHYPFLVLSLSFRYIREYLKSNVDVGTASNLRCVCTKLAGFPWQETKILEWAKTIPTWNPTMVKIEDAYFHFPYRMLTADQLNTVLAKLTLHREEMKHQFKNASLLLLSNPVTELTPAQVAKKRVDLETQNKQLKSYLHAVINLFNHVAAHNQHRQIYDLYQTSPPEEQRNIDLHLYQKLFELEARDIRREHSHDNICFKQKSLLGARLQEWLNAVSLGIGYRLPSYLLSGAHQYRTTGNDKTYGMITIVRQEMSEREILDALNLVATRPRRAPPREVLETAGNTIRQADTFRPLTTESFQQAYLEVVGPPAEERPREGPARLDIRHVSRGGDVSQRGSASSEASSKDSAKGKGEQKGSSSYKGSKSSAKTGDDDHPSSGKSRSSKSDSSGLIPTLRRLEKGLPKGGKSKSKDEAATASAPSAPFRGYDGQVGYIDGFAFYADDFEFGERRNFNCVRCRAECRNHPFLSEVGNLCRGCYSDLIEEGSLPVDIKRLSTSSAEDLPREEAEATLQERLLEILKYRVPNNEQIVNLLIAEVGPFRMREFLEQQVALGTFQHTPDPDRVRPPNIAIPFVRPASLQECYTTALEILAANPIGGDNPRGSIDPIPGKGHSKGKRPFSEAIGEEGEEINSNTRVRCRVSGYSKEFELTPDGILKAVELASCILNVAAADTPVEAAEPETTGVDVEMSGDTIEAAVEDTPEEGTTVEAVEGTLESPTLVTSLEPPSTLRTTLSQPSALDGILVETGRLVETARIVHVKSQEFCGDPRSSRIPANWFYSNLLCSMCAKPLLPLMVQCLRCKTVVPFEQIDPFCIRRELDELEDPLIPLPGTTERTFNIRSYLGTDNQQVQQGPSEIHLNQIVHWTQCFANDEAHISQYEMIRRNFRNKLGPYRFENYLDNQPHRSKVTQAWIEHGIIHRQDPIEVDDFLPTPGKWYYTKITFDVNYTTDLGGRPDHILKLAYHGTSLSCAAQILKNGFLTGPRRADNAVRNQGIFCEPRSRLSAVMHYATHTLPKHSNHASSFLFSACVLELLVNRECDNDGNYVWPTMEESGSWIIPGQDRPRNFIIVGIYTHQLPFSKIYSSGYEGHFMIHGPSFEQVMRQSEWN